MELKLEGKTVLVTGGGSGLGKAICERFAAEQANVIVHYRSNKTKAEQFVQTLNAKTSGTHTLIYADLEVKEEVHHLFEKAAAIYHSIDILVNNAGIWLTSAVADMDETDFERTLAVNLTAPFILCKKMILHLSAEHKKGKIVNIVSQAAFNGSTSGHAHYAAAKAGLVSFSKSLAREVGEQGINVNCAAPGIVITPMVTKDRTRSELAETYYPRIPLKRLAEPEELADAVLFLSSCKADYITGATLDITGGMLMR